MLLRLNWTVLFLSSVCSISQSRALRLPSSTHNLEISRTHNLDSVFNACTTNITIPTLPEQCISPCKLFQETQLVCQDYTDCMCISAPPPTLQSCMICVLDGLRNFRHSGIIDETETIVKRYTASCESILQPSASKSSENPWSEGDACVPPKPPSLMKATSPHTHLTQTSYHLFIIFVTFATSVLLLIIACLYPRLWKQLGLI